MKTIPPISIRFGFDNSHGVTQVLSATHQGHRRNKRSFRQPSLSRTLMVASLAATLGIGTAYADSSGAYTSQPQSHNPTAPASRKVSSRTGYGTEAKIGRVGSDTWITTKVKSEILANSVSKGFDVNVKTIRGVVILKGVLPNQEAINRVKDIAQKVDDVKSVDTSSLTIARR
ncbi:MAG: BON domain-containing protein [Acidiferrobacteraceae bacterium]